MRHDQRHGVGMTRLDVDELDIDAVDRRHELRQGIQLRLRLTPVVVGSPVLDEWLDLRELHTLRLIRDGLALGPSRRHHPPPEVGECLVGHVNAEGADRVAVVFGRAANLHGGQAADGGLCGGRRSGLGVAGRGEEDDAEDASYCRKQAAPRDARRAVPTTRGLAGRRMHPVFESGHGGFPS
jgi:hypothetical protein